MAKGRWRKPEKDAFYRPPRRARIDDPERTLSIRKNGSSWTVTNGNGVVLLDSAPSNQAALEWLASRKGQRATSAAAASR
jgi:hypothetical protein